LVYETKDDLLEVALPYFKQGLDLWVLATPVEMVVKLDLHNRAELITFAVREGIINGNDVQESNQAREN